MDIAKYCGVVSTAKFVYIKAYDGLQKKSSPNRSHETGCFDRVHQWDGAPLTTDHGGPCKDDYPASISLERRKMDW